MLRNKPSAGKLAVVILLASLSSNLVSDWSVPRDARAASLVADGGPQPEGGGTPPAATYHTPLAGEAGSAKVFGYPVQIPALDRGHMTSITFGGSLLDPKQADTRGLPFAALWLRRVWENSRTRDLVSVFVNELEYDRSFGNLEMVGHFENTTIPGGRAELVQNREAKATSQAWGSLMGSLGPGLRFAMAPYQVDNDLRIQLLGRVGYFYAARTDETGASQVLPPDTLLYGAKLRVRYDNMRRNLLELPHRGFATGFDLDYISRANWSDLGTSGNLHHGNPDYFQSTGYLVGAGGIPGLSERDRVFGSLYGGTTLDNRGDRYNAFRINGGPFPSEADDLARVHYTGIIFDDILATKYATASLGYRRELTFFLYLSLIGSYLWADRSTAAPNTAQVEFKSTSGLSSTVSLDTAFLWNSEIYLAYAWESGVIRGGKAGNGLLLTWNKLF